jgi:hypothetical protein
MPPAEHQIKFRGSRTPLAKQICSERESASHCAVVLFATMQSHKPTEPSEEVRLKLVQLLVLIMDQAGSAIAAYASEVWSMVTAVLSDSFHEVSMQGCKVAQRLAGAPSRALMLCCCAAEAGAYWYTFFLLQHAGCVMYTRVVCSCAACVCFVTSSSCWPCVPTCAVLSLQPSWD